MDKLQWFKFSPIDWVMGKIQKCPEATQARFLNLMCLYWNKECKLTLEDAIIEVDKEHIDILISKKVIKVNELYIVIDFLDSQRVKVSNTSEKRKLAANARWSNKQEENANALKNDANALQMNASELQSDAEKKREDKIRKEEKRKEAIKERKLKFASTLKDFIDVYGKEMIKEFYAYWTEENKSGTKFKQELEKTWDVSRRLEMWARNDKTFKKEKIPEQKEKEKNVIGRQGIDTVQQNILKFYNHGE